MSLSSKQPIQTENIPSNAKYYAFKNDYYDLSTTHTLNTLLVKNIQMI